MTKKGLRPSGLNFEPGAWEKDTEIAIRPSIFVHRFSIYLSGPSKVFSNWLKLIWVFLSRFGPRFGGPGLFVYLFHLGKAAGSSGTRLLRYWIRNNQALTHSFHLNTFPPRAEISSRWRNRPLWALGHIYSGIVGSAWGDNIFSTWVAFRFLILM